MNRRDFFSAAFAAAWSATASAPTDARAHPSTTGNGLLAQAHERLPAIIATTAQLVRCESPSADASAIAASAALVAALGETLLSAIPEIIDDEGTAHVRWRFGSAAPKVLILAHHDTVWPVGTLDRLPWSYDGGMLRGPGCLDMKAGIALSFHALSMLREAGHSLDGVSVLVTGDEEIGSTTSRELIEAEAAGCDAVLVFESARPSGALKTGRKGPSRYQMDIRGRAAHAGLEPESGANASVELAHQILAVASISDANAGTTVTPTTVHGGTTSNTVPAAAAMSIDARAWTQAEQQRVDAAIKALPAMVPGCTVHVTGGPTRPPMDPASSAALFTRAQAVATEHGLGVLCEESVGGASDGNLTAGMGIPTLDGLGGVGSGAHADDEHVLVATIPGRTALAAGLISSLLDAP